ncbi:hypothetical protein N7474_011202 [Penicillium riverlandense]|uniref:uncharacterized protein n=1 Tax=Penicillium riverlandense TaxID=1903569 RepID=UPI002547472F|nr:uncharacterized protein N7474_011202 [Penicillium riverlandense]KAJ5805315.1 hypothetical protein N7474_011202 [Penicillium riverlandense]
MPVMAVYPLLWLLGPLSTLAHVQVFTPPGQTEITYSVNIPEDTATSGSGPVYFQLKSTSPVQWFAWGQGDQMQGANIFVVYVSGDNNNVTVSPRLGEGHFEPRYNRDARVSLLDGSGVRDGTITANIRCDTCISWSDGSENVTSTTSPYIWAVKYGPPLDTSDVTATITKHDDMGGAIVNMRKATGGHLTNPFSDVFDSSVAEAVGPPFDIESIYRQRIAHAVLMIIAFVVFFPFFALGLHLCPASWTPKIHGLAQSFVLMISIAGMGLGVSMAHAFEMLQHHHPIIGLVVVSGLVLFQPLMGLLQHRHFRKTGGKSAFASLHRWFGRAMIVLGIVNAGLGFRMTREANPGAAPRAVMIAYSVVAGVVGVGYVLVVGARTIV